MEILHIYDRNFFLWPRLKHAAKKVLGRGFGGPQAVQQSLINGLRELGQNFALNEPKSPTVACVLSGVDTLRQVILWKQSGLVKKILAGPNLVVMPQDSDKIIQHPLIDVVLQPSQWSADFYVSQAPSLGAKIRVWPAGVAVPPPPKTEKTVDFLVYNKIGKNPLFAGIINALKSSNYFFEVFNYGKFKQEQYFRALSRSKAMIYLSESESQGLAMFEAWARNVPVFAWERGFWQLGKFRESGLTATPYLNSECGQRFKDFTEFKNGLPKFMSSVFHARNYAEENFSDKICARKYLSIVNELQS